MDFTPAEVAARLEQGVQTGAFPGAAALWGPPADAPRRALAGRRGRRRDAVPVSFDLIYDLASLTKLLSGASLAMTLVEAGRLELDRPLIETPLARRLPAAAPRGGPWAGLTAEKLLAHQSGLRPWLPLHRLPNVPPEERSAAALAAIWRDSALAPDCGPGRRTIYSDLNFILLGFLLEEVGGAGLAELFQQLVARPLALARLGFRPRRGPLAPTEDGFRWGGPIGCPEAGFRGPVPLGRVHDDNAAWLGGVAGHAGLFGPADDIWTLAADWGRAWSEGRGRLFSREVLADFIRPRPTREDSGRPLGFNIKAQQSALAGSRFSGSAVGHTGYTGPSLWWDPEQNFLWLFLTNRVQPRAANPAWRPARYQGGPAAA